jgi:hypothetical protein
VQPVHLVTAEREQIGARPLDVVLDDLYMSKVEPDPLALTAVIDRPYRSRRFRQRKSCRR